MKKNVIAIVGPTAVGKTKLSIEAAKKLNGEIISGDAMQIYKGMDIGTAKITKEEMQGIPHHMIDIKQPDESFSAAEFQQLVQSHIEEISSSGKMPIIVGGSGLYIQAALFNYNFSRRQDSRITARLQEKVRKEGIAPLYEQLKQIDPSQAEKVHPNNERRVIRAIEVYEKTGMTMSEYQQQQEKSSPYHIYFVGLTMERELLYERINNRVDEMIEQGLIREVRELYNNGYKDMQSMKAIGYKEFIPYFEGKQSLESTIEILKRNSRRYAKRQYTWFKNKMDIRWYEMEEGAINETFRIILEDLAGFFKER
ncbi:tRNA (adenosine(37)-N6)-dimethylallyltransferase MiaA [Virgibacillus kimchii]